MTLVSRGLPQRSGTSTIIRELLVRSAARLSTSTVKFHGWSRAPAERRWRAASMSEFAIEQSQMLPRSGTSMRNTASHAQTASGRVQTARRGSEVEDPAAGLPTATKEIRERGRVEPTRRSRFSRELMPTTCARAFIDSW